MCPSGHPCDVVLDPIQCDIDHFEPESIVAGQTRLLKRSLCPQRCLHCEALFLLDMRQDKMLALPGGLYPNLRRNALVRATVQRSGAIVNIEVVDSGLGDGKD